MSQNKSSEVIEYKQRMSKIFDGAAPIYGQVGPPFFTHFGRRLAEIADIPSGSKVLDAATGRGAVLFPAAKFVGYDGNVIGIDFSERMVQETKAAAARLKISKNIEVRQMDAEDLQFPDETFNLVLCGFAIFFFPQLYQAMGEFRRVLKPGGFICTSTFDKLFDDEWTWLDEIVETYLPSEPGAGDDEESISESQPVFNTPEGLTTIMNTAGFEDIQIFTETAEFIYATEEELWSTLWSHGFRGTLKKIEKERGPDGLESFKSEVFNKLNTLKESDGLHQQIPVHFCLATKPEN